MNKNSTITLANVSKSYGPVGALKGIELVIQGGECVALVGPNGAGKSTMIKLILGLISPTSGTLNVLGHRPGENSFTNERAHIGFLPEQVLFQGSLSGRETLSFYASLKGDYGHQIDELLERVDLVEAADRRVSTYSKGMRQRLGLAQALVGAPKILILDEPTSGLDPAARANFFAIVEREKSRGAAILMASHGLTELEARTDRVAILNKGVLVANGTIGELKRKLSLTSKIKIRTGKAQLDQLAKHFSGQFNETCLINGIAVLECDHIQKVSVLRDLMSCNLTLDDVEIVEPTLESVFYAYTTAQVTS